MAKSDATSASVPSRRIISDFNEYRSRGGGPGVTAKGLYPHISRTKVAELLSCDPSTVTGYLAGRTKMPLDRAIKFAKLAGIPVETLQRDLSRVQAEFAGQGKSSALPTGARKRKT